ncbi:MogA/MoaB family molybdenum cofactor biosynthesis protein [Haloferacaceae archaeon DSL9]
MTTNDHSTRTPTTAPTRRRTDNHGHDIVTPLQFGVVTVSSSRAGESAPRNDPSGDAIASILAEYGHGVVERTLVSDDYSAIQRALDAFLDDPTVDAVVTTGGTGVTIDDVTADAASDRFDRELPGFGELFRKLSYDEIGSRIVATRAAAGIARDTPVFVLPGSRNAVRLATESIIVEEAPHLVGLATRHLAEE